MLSGHSIEFQQIYKFAKDKDVSGLKKLIADGVSLNISENGMMPATLLAMENDHDAINLLIGNFGISMSGPAFGYAAIKNDEQVMRLLKLGAPRKAVLMGYGMGNHRISSHIWHKLYTVEHALLYIQKGNAMGNHIDYISFYDANNLIHSYALVGNSEKVNECLQITRRFNLIEDEINVYKKAVQGYCAGNHLEELDDLAQQYTKINISNEIDIAKLKLRYNICFGRNKVNAISKNATDNESIINLYLHGNHTTQVEDIYSTANPNRFLFFITHLEKDIESYLYLLSFIRNDNLRKMLIEFSVIPESANSTENTNQHMNEVELNFLRAKVLLSDAEKINQYMNDLELNYFQARALLSQNARRWLTAGFTTLNRLLPVDLVNYIVSIGMDLSLTDTADLTKKFRFYIFKQSIINELENKFVISDTKDTISTSHYLRKFFSTNEQIELKSTLHNLSERAKALNDICLHQSISPALSAISQEKKHAETMTSATNISATKSTTMKLFKPTQTLQKIYCNTIQQQCKKIGL